MIIRDKVKIPTLSGDKERTSYVYLPKGYGKDENRRYPVLYMFDGHNLFSDKEATYGKSWGLSKYLDSHKTPLIVAAVECNHDGNMRLSEYSPVDITFDGTKIVGRGKKYMDWLVSDFKNSIDEKYLTLGDRQNTFIAGSSMGGLMTLYALAKYGKYFSRGAALSPSLWINGGSLPDFFVNARYRSDAVLFTDYGTKEFKNHAAQLVLFGEAVKMLCDKKVAVTARVVPGGIHSEVTWEKEIPYFIPVLMGDTQT